MFVALFFGPFLYFYVYKLVMEGMFGLEAWHRSRGQFAAALILKV